MKIRTLILASMLLLAGCSEFTLDWKQSVHDSLVNMCETQSNCDK